MKWLFPLLLLCGCASNVPMPPGAVSRNVTRQVMVQEQPRTLLQFTVMADFMPLGSQTTLADQAYFDIYTNLSDARAFRIYVPYPINGGTVISSFGMWSPVPELYFRSGFTVIRN